MSQALSPGPGPGSCLDIRILDSNSISVWSGSSVWIRLFAWFDPDLCLDIWILNSNFSSVGSGLTKARSGSFFWVAVFGFIPPQTWSKTLSIAWKSKWKLFEIEKSKKLIFIELSHVLFTSLISSKLCLIGWLESKESRSSVKYSLFIYLLSILIFDFSF